MKKTLVYSTKVYLFGTLFDGKLSEQGTQDSVMSTIIAMKVRLEGEKCEPDKLIGNCDKNRGCCPWDLVKGFRLRGKREF